MVHLFNIHCFYNFVILKLIYNSTLQMASGFSIFAQTFLFYEASHAITVNRYPTISLFLFLHARASAHAHSSNSVRKIYVEKVRNQR